MKITSINTNYISKEKKKQIENYINKNNFNNSFVYEENGDEIFLYKEDSIGIYNIKTKILISEYNNMDAKYLIKENEYWLSKNDKEVKGYKPIFILSRFALVLTNKNDDIIIKNLYEEPIKKYINHTPVIPYELLKLKTIRHKQYKKINNTNWDAMSDYIYGLSIIYKKGKYGVINNNYEIVFNYDDNINYIKIISQDKFMLKNNHGQSAIYQIGVGYLINFGDNILFDDAACFSENIIKLTSKNSHQIYYNGKIKPLDCDNIICDENIIIVEKNAQTTFYDINFNKIFSINSTDFSKSQNNIYYRENNVLHRFNTKTLEDEKLDIYIKTEDGYIPSSKYKEEVYNFEYYDSSSKMPTLFKNQKYGIKIQFGNNVERIKWFDTQEEVYQFKNAMLDVLMDMTSNFLEEKKKILKNMIITK